MVALLSPNMQEYHLQLTLKIFNYFTGKWCRQVKNARSSHSEIYLIASYKYNIISCLQMIMNNLVFT